MFKDTLTYVGVPPRFKWSVTFLPRPAWSVICTFLEILFYFNCLDFMNSSGYSVISSESLVYTFSLQVNFTLFSRLPSASCSSHYFFLLSIGKHLQKVKFPTHHFLMLLAWLLLLLIFLPCLVVFLVFLRCPTPYPSDSPMFQTTLVIIHVHAVLEFIMPTSAKLSFQAVTFHFISY